MSIKTFLSAVTSYVQSGHATEHTYRMALCSLLGQFIDNIEIINEPTRSEYGSPDILLLRDGAPLGYVEAKDLLINLDRIVIDSEEIEPNTREGKQLKRYRSGLNNLLFTNGIEWYWFLNEDRQLGAPVRIADWDKKNKKLIILEDSFDDLVQLFNQFSLTKSQHIITSIDLAKKLAKITEWLYETILNVLLRSDSDSDSELQQQYKAFKDVLLPQLEPDKFADMYAQTVVYGLFAARVINHQNKKNTFTRYDAAHTIPKTNPFLRRLFQTVTGDNLDDDISWIIDTCAYVLQSSDMDSILQNFGKKTRQEDPVFHFYETFLAEYNSKMKESRGVFYTPQPVVGWIVRSVDTILRMNFLIDYGLSDENVIILDPATGTATFLYEVIQTIYNFLHTKNIPGGWNSYVSEKLLPRINGFELLMAPYTIAHIQLGFLLSELGYEFSGNERLGIYLTDTLSDAPTGQKILPFAKYIAEEGEQANRIKLLDPVMVVLGNPPYSSSSLNNSPWIEDLMKRYKTTIRDEETQIQGVSNDYVKFLRFAHWRIETTGHGVIAMIVNNGFIDGFLFRDMRHSLLEDFDEIYILNLLGDTFKSESAKSGVRDENVFSIKQGNCIIVLIRYKDKLLEPVVRYKELMGSREYKYTFLDESDLHDIDWMNLTPIAPEYMFVPAVSLELASEYDKYWKLTDIFGTGKKKIDDKKLYGTGFITQQDEFAIAYSPEILISNISKLLLPSMTESKLRQKFNLCTTEQWNFSKAKKALSSMSIKDLIQKCLYRPFDYRYTIFNKHVCTITRRDIMRHFDKPNISLLSTKRITQSPFDNVFVSDIYPEYKLVSHNRNTLVFPLYVYEETDVMGPMFSQESLDTGRRPNFNSKFIIYLEEMLSLKFVNDGKGDLQITFGPEDIFHFIYGILHSSIYRDRYDELFIKRNNGPHVPVPNSRNMFIDILLLGAELVDLHLLRLPGKRYICGVGGARQLAYPENFGISFPESGSNVVNSVRKEINANDHYDIYINTEQYFSGIPKDIYNMKIGGYQVLAKWLKDRAKDNRVLSFDDIQHYMRIIVALIETDRVVNKINEVVSVLPFE